MARDWLLVVKDPPLRKLFFIVVASLARIIMVTGDDAVADEAEKAAFDRSAVYDIPAQSLDAALSTYIKISGAQVFYESTLTIGRQSTRIRGQFAPAAALQILLTGTGLVGRRMDVDAFVVATAPREALGASVPMAARDRHFVGALQARLLEALCANPQTRPGGYKIAFELWVMPNGIVQRSALVGSTEDEFRDAALIKAVQGLAVGTAIPVDMPQPIIMAISPRSPHETGDCISP
jgi:hypothetical protein